MKKIRSALVAACTLLCSAHSIAAIELNTLDDIQTAECVGSEGPSPKRAVDIPTASGLRAKAFMASTADSKGLRPSIWLAINGKRLQLHSTSAVPVDKSGRFETEDHITTLVIGELCQCKWKFFNLADTDAWAKMQDVTFTISQDKDTKIIAGNLVCSSPATASERAQFNLVRSLYADVLNTVTLINAHRNDDDSFPAVPLARLDPLPSQGVKLEWLKTTHVVRGTIVKQDDLQGRWVEVNLDDKSCVTDLPDGYRMNNCTVPTR